MNNIFFKDVYFFLKIEILKFKIVPLYEKF